MNEVYKDKSSCIQNKSLLQIFLFKIKIGAKTPSLSTSRGHRPPDIRISSHAAASEFRATSSYSSSTRPPALDHEDISQHSQGLISLFHNILFKINVS